MNEPLMQNKKRIREFDLARALAVLTMIAVHTEFAIYNYETTWFGTLMDYLGSPFAAPVFMFILGANIHLTTKNSPKQLFTRGLSIFCLSLLFNIVCHALPFFILDYINQQTLYAENALHWIFAVDILTFSGLAFMFFALAKKCKLSNIALAVIGVVASIVNIILTYNCPVDFNSNPLLAAITSLFYNSSITGYFSFFSWIIFPIAGYLFIQARMAAQDTNRFHLIAGGTSLIVYLFCVLVSYIWFPNLPFVEFREEYSYYQMHPFNALGNIAFCIAWISILYFVSKILPNVLDKWIHRLNHNLTSIYVIQWFLINYCFVLLSNNTFFVNEWQYLLCALAVVLLSDFLAWLYEKYKAWKIKI